MKRICQIFCISLFVLALATTAMATGTRVMTMGDQDMFITDDYNVWHWTSTVNNYPRHMIADVWSTQSSVPGAFSGYTRIGMIMPFMSNGVIGAFISDQRADVGSFFTNDSDPRDVDSRIDLFWGTRMSSADIGVHLEWWGDSDKRLGENSSSILGLAVGVAMNQGGNMMEFNAHVRKISFTNEEATSGPAFDTNNVQDAGSNFGVAWRWMKSVNSSTTIIPAFRFETYKLSETLEPVGQTAQEQKRTTFDAGVGYNVVPLSGTEFLGSIGFMFDKFEQGDTSAAGNIERTTLSTPYIKFGADIQVRPWLDFRVGATKYVFQKVTEKDLATPANPDRVYTNANFDWHLGAGIMLGDIEFDFELDPNFLFTGPYFLSGNSSDMFWYASFKYDYR